MKMLLIRDKYIIKEHARFIDRDHDTMYVDFIAKYKHGATAEDSAFLEDFNFVFQYSKEQGQAGWDKLKTLEQQESLHMLYCTLLAHYEEYFKMKEKIKDLDVEEAMEIQQKYAQYYTEATAMGSEKFILHGSYPLANVQNMVEFLYAQGVQPNEITFEEMDKLKE